jgi:hypothetical protein
MNRGRTAKKTVKPLVDLLPIAQFSATLHGEPYVENPEAFELARAWCLIARQDDPCSKDWRRMQKPGSVEMFARQVRDGTADFMHAVVASGQTRALRELADAVDHLVGLIEPTDPLRNWIVFLASYRTGKTFYAARAPRRVPFTLSQLLDFLARRMDEDVDERSVRRAVAELGIRLKPDRIGRPRK